MTLRDRGGTADLRALRATHATVRARAEVWLVQDRKLLRHSDPMLAANTHTRLRLEGGREAVARIDVPGTLRRAAR